MSHTLRSTVSTLTGHDFSSHKSTLILVTPASSPHYQAFTTTTKRKERLKHVLDHVQETPRVELRTTGLLVFFTEPLFIYLYMCVWVCGGMFLYLDVYQMSLQGQKYIRQYRPCTDIWLV